MKIGIDVRSLGEPIRGGIWWYVFYLLHTMFRLDQKNEYFLFYNGCKRVSPSLPEFQYPNVWYKTFRIPNKLLNARFKWQGRPYIDRMIHPQGLDWFWLPNQHFFSVSPFCNVVMTVHDLSFEHFPEFFTTVHMLWHKLVDQRSMMMRVHRIVAVSDATKSDIIETYGVSETRVQTIYPGVWHRHFRRINDQFQKQRLAAQYRLPEKFFLYLGTLEPRKNVTMLIRAYDAARRNWNGTTLFPDLVLAGARGWKAEHIIRAVSCCASRQYIQFLHYVPEKDKSLLYNCAYAFVYPSWYEGFGLPVLEAMACGTPVITSTVSALPEVVGDAGLLIDPGNEHELAFAMKTMVKEKDLYDLFVHRSLERAKEFSWEKAAQEMLDIFEQKVPKNVYAHRH